MTVTDVSLPTVAHTAPTNASDPRGATRQLKFDDGFQVTVCERFAGTASNPHVHSGSDKSKNPEKLYLASGSAVLTYRNPSSGQTRNVRIEKGDSISIPPGVPHKLVFAVDSIILELRSTHFDPKNPDTVAAEL